MTHRSAAAWAAGRAAAWAAAAAVGDSWRTSRKRFCKWRWSVSRGNRPYASVHLYCYSRFGHCSRSFEPQRCHCTGSGAAAMGAAAWAAARAAATAAAARVAATAVAATA
eukprot:scaffold43085_cov30-Phaeocystis_antarctica.AAC.1